MVDNTGEITLAKSYAPYGEVTYSAGNGASPFAYTGEQTDPTGLTYLRARYYSGDVGRFLSRDTWGGDYNNPLSFNRWSYVEGNPINITDPSGHFPEWCRSKWTKWGYAKCVLDYFNLESAGSIFFNGEAVKEVKGSPGCWSGPIQYRAAGYIEGFTWFGTILWGGEEIVYSFARMERSKFTYNGVGINDSVLGGGVAFCVGMAEGLRSDKLLVNHYKGLAFIETSGLDFSTPFDGVGVGLGVTKTTSVQDWKLKTYSAYVGVSGSLGLPYADVGYGFASYEADLSTDFVYQPGEFGSMMTDLVLGKFSPLPQTIKNMNASAIYWARAYAAVEASKYYYVYMEMKNEKERSNLLHSTSPE